MSPRPLPAHVLIPVANPSTAEELVRIGAALAEARAGELTVLGMVEVPEGRPLSDGATRARQARRLLQRVVDFAPEGTPVHPIVRIGRNAASGIVEAAAEAEADLIVFGWGGKASAREGTAGVVISPTIDRVVREAPCDIAVVKQRGSGDVRRILVPIRGGPHAELALRFADGIARRHDATVDVLHLVAPGITPAIRGQEEHALAALIRQHLGGRGNALLEETQNVRAAILREAETADIVIMGASAAPASADQGDGILFGALPEAIATRARASVVVVRTREPIGSATFERLAEKAESLVAADRAAEEARAIPARVERWFGESNFHHSEFADLERLVQLKAHQRLSVSLVLTTDDGELIAPLARRVRRELIDPVALVDELLVVGPEASEEARIAIEAAGGRYVGHPEVLARYGSLGGRGDALWKSLYETSGDLVVWVGADPRSWGPRLVYGMLGPLLVEPRIQYVTGYGQRPLLGDDPAAGSGGSRVTELVARPLLGLFFPELSGIVQPLGGELAGRRELLETLPFFSGDAVAIGHLIDVADRVGLEGIGQVDLERRLARDREGDPRTAFVIVQAVMRRLEERRKARLFAELGTTLRLPHAEHGRLVLRGVELADHERPPIARIPEYAERRSAPAEPE